MAHYRLNIADRKMVIGVVGTAVIEIGEPVIVINMTGIGGAAEFIDMKFETFDAEEYPGNDAPPRTSLAVERNYGCHGGEGHTPEQSSPSTE